MIFLTLEEVIIFHTIQIKKYGGSLGIRDIRLLESAILRPQTTFGGVDLYPDVFTKAGVLAQSLIKNHAFIDGNKRTGIHSALVFLRLYGEEAKFRHAELVQLALRIANNKITPEKIAEFFKKSL